MIRDVISLGDKGYDVARVINRGFLASDYCSGNVENGML